MNAVVYIGTYTAGTKSEGIYACDYCIESGMLSPPRLAVKTENPSYLILGHNKILYSVNELDTIGQVSGYMIDKHSSLLTFLGTVKYPGSLTCHLSMHPILPLLFASNYGSGSLTSITCDNMGAPDNISCNLYHRGNGPNSARQETAHTHSTQISQDGKTLLAADLGCDKLFRYTVEPSGYLTLCSSFPYLSAPAGSGPRHFTIHPNKKFLYVAGELDTSVTVFKRQNNGCFKIIQTISMSDKKPCAENLASEIHFSPNSKSLYVSNRGLDTIVRFEADCKTGLLSSKQTINSGGKGPRSFCIDPSGTHLIVTNQYSNNITVFKLSENGNILPSACSTVQIPSPVCSLLMPYAAERNFV